MYLKLSKHVKEQMTCNRARMSHDTLVSIAKHLGTLVNKYNPDNIHQVAVKIADLPRVVKVGYSEGDCLIFTVDIRTRVITTAFVRYRTQGIPKSCQVYIDFDGKQVQ